MRLSTEEKNAIEQICTYSCLDYATTKSLYEAFSIYSGVMAQEGNEIIIPNVGVLKVELIDKYDAELGRIKKDLDVQIIPFESFKETVINIKEGNLSEIKQMVNANISKELEKILIK